MTGPAQRRLTGPSRQATAEHVENLARGGVSDAAIADRLDLSTRQVARLRRECEIPAGERRWLPDKPKPTSDDTVDGVVLATPTTNSSPDEEHSKIPAEPPVAAHAQVLRVRPSGQGFGVFTVEHGGEAYQKQPCHPCPWRRDAPIGAFPPQAYRDSAHTTYDQSTTKFGCHAVGLSRPHTCAGFLLRGASDNINVRLAIMTGELDVADVKSQVELYASYREMAIANGVDPDDPSLRPCRGDREPEGTEASG